MPYESKTASKTYVCILNIFTRLDDLLSLLLIVFYSSPEKKFRNVTDILFSCII